MRLYTLAVALLLALILAAHAVAPDTYRWTQHTMSHLGAQVYEYANIMRLGFVSYGALILVAAILKVMKAVRTAWPHSFIGIYGFAILLTGFFSTSPFLPGAQFSVPEANLHSIFATLSGIAISTAMVAFAIMHRSRLPRIIDVVTLVLTILMSGAFFAFGDVAGVFQRLLWLVGFAWLILLEVPSLEDSPQARNPSA